MLSARQNTSAAVPNCFDHVVDKEGQYPVMNPGKVTNVKQISLYCIILMLLLLLSQYANSSQSEAVVPTMLRNSLHSTQCLTVNLSCYLGRRRLNCPYASLLFSKRPNSGASIMCAWLAVLDLITNFSLCYVNNPENMNDLEQCETRNEQRCRASKIRS